MEKKKKKEEKKEKEKKKEKKKEKGKDKEEEEKKEKGKNNKNINKNKSNTKNKSQNKSNNIISNNNTAILKTKSKKKNNNNNNDKNSNKNNEEENKKINQSFESFESKDSNKNIFSKLTLGGNSNHDYINNNEEIKYISDVKNTPVELRNTLKSELNEEKNESSGKFGASESNFKELLKKLIEDKNTKQKSTNIIKKNKNIKKGKEIIKNITIIGKNNKKEKIEEIKENINENDNNSFNNMNFTLNGENIKNDKIEEDNNKINKEEKKEEKKIESFSSQKKRIDVLHNSNVNLNKEISLNSISTIDNNIDSMKITGSYYHSINKLISDIGSRRGRRKSNITNSYFKNKGIFNINDMVSFSSSLSNNLFNNNLDIYQRRNSNFQISRYNSTQNITKDNLNNFVFLKNFKTINIEKTNKNEKSNNGSSQNSGQDSLSLINKLKNLNLSLENERSYSNILKNINNTKKMNENNKNIFTFSKTPDISRNHSRNIINKKKYKSKISSHEMNTESTKSTTSNFYYPDVYYINGENNLHKKTHVSTFFSKLKNYNNKKYM